MPSTRKNLIMGLESKIVQNMVLVQMYQLDD